MPNETDRRQRLRYFRATGTQAALKAAIAEAAPSLTGFDANRIIGMLDKPTNRLDDYPGPPKRLVCRAWCVEWVGRISRLTVQAKTVIPELARSTEGGMPSHEREQLAARILFDLWRYEGDCEDSDAFRSWAMAWFAERAKMVSNLYEWIESHKTAVREGIRSVVLSCGKLGGCEYIVQELEVNVWTWVSQRIERFVASEKPLQHRLYSLGRKFAKSWKSKARSDRARFRELKAADRQVVRNLYGGRRTVVPASE